MDSAKKHHFTTFIGIDPGLSGAVAVLDQQGVLVLVEDLPTCRQGGFIKRRVDPTQLRAIVAPYAQDSLVALELVGARTGQGALSGASLASSMACCEGVLVGLGAERVLRLPPMIWKAGMGLVGRGKGGSVDRAKALTGRTLRHDQAEAVLLARFAWLQRDKPLVSMAQDDQPQTQPRAKAPAPRSRKQKHIAEKENDDLGAFAVAEVEGQD